MTVCFTTDSDDLLLLVATETGVISTKLNGSSAEYIGGMLSIDSNGRFVYPVFYLLSIHLHGLLSSCTKQPSKCTTSMSYIMWCRSLCDLHTEGLDQRP